MKSQRGVIRYRGFRDAPGLVGLGAALICLSFACSVVDTPAVQRAPASDESFFTTLHQLTFEGQNAEAYFSPDGSQLIFQRQ